MWVCIRNFFLFLTANTVLFVICNVLHICNIIWISIFQKTHNTYARWRWKGYEEKCDTLSSLFHIDSLKGTFSNFQISCTIQFWLFHSVFPENRNNFSNSIVFSFNVRLFHWKQIPIILLRKTLHHKSRITLIFIHHNLTTIWKCKKFTLQGTNTFNLGRLFFNSTQQILYVNIWIETLGVLKLKQKLTRCSEIEKKKRKKLPYTTEVFHTAVLNVLNITLTLQSIKLIRNLVTVQIGIFKFSPSPYEIHQNSKIILKSQRT